MVAAAVAIALFNAVNDPVSQAFKALGSVVLVAVGASFMCSEASHMKTEGIPPHTADVELGDASDGARDRAVSERRRSIIETSFLSPEKEKLDEKDKEVGSGPYSNPKLNPTPLLGRSGAFLGV